MNYNYLIIAFIFFLFFLYIKITSNVFIELFSIKKYNDIMLNNDKKKLYKILISEEIPLETEDCNDKCDQSNCIKMKILKNNLEKCLKCNRQKKKCFKKSIIGGNCDDCMDEEQKINCYDLKNFGCKDPKDINSNIGVKPYFIQIPDNSINSPYNKKCSFCWDIFDLN